MKLEYRINKPEDTPEDKPGELTPKGKYGVQTVQGKEVIIYHPYTGKSIDLSAFKKTIIGFRSDEKTGKNTGEK